MPESATIDKLVDLFHCSQRKGEAVKLFLESKNGEDSITFSINPTGSPAGGARTWSPRPVSPTPPWPCSWTPQKPMRILRRKKTPSMLRRDQKRKVEFLAKKAALASVEVKVDPTCNSDTTQKVNLVEPVDETALTEIPDDMKEITENAIINIVGEYKNPKFKAWSFVNPEEEAKNLWKSIEDTNKALGINIKEIDKGFEHCYEFWGSWKIENGSKVTTDALKNPNSWSRGTNIRDVKVKSAKE